MSDIDRNEITNILSSILQNNQAEELTEDYEAALSEERNGEGTNKVSDEEYRQIFLEHFGIDINTLLPEDRAALIDLFKGLSQKEEGEDEAFTNRDFELLREAVGEAFESSMEKLDVANEYIDIFLKTRLGGGVLTNQQLDIILGNLYGEKFESLNDTQKEAMRAALRERVKDDNLDIEELGQLNRFLN